MTLHPKLSAFLAPVEARVKKATPGPWKLFARGKTISVSLPEHFGKTPCIVNWPGFDGCDLPLKEQKANAALITHAPTDLTTLLKIVSAQAEVIERWELFSAARLSMPQAEFAQGKKLEEAESALNAILEDSK